MSLQDSNFKTSHVLQIIGLIFLVFIQNAWIVYAKNLIKYMLIEMIEMVVDVVGPIFLIN
jgi:hypothetical protein